MGVLRRERNRILLIEEQLHDERIKVRELKGIIGLAYEKIASHTLKDFSVPDPSEYDLENAIAELNSTLSV